MYIIIKHYNTVLIHQKTCFMWNWSNCTSFVFLSAWPRQNVLHQCFCPFLTFNWATTSPPSARLHRCDWWGPLLRTPWLLWGGWPRRAPPCVSDPPPLAVDEGQDAPNSCQVPLHLQPEGSVQGLAGHAQHQRWGGQLRAGEEIEAAFTFAALTTFFFKCIPWPLTCHVRMKPGRHWLDFEWRKRVLICLGIEGFYKNECALEIAGREGIAATAAKKKDIKYHYRECSLPSKVNWKFSWQWCYTL